MGVAPLPNEGVFGEADGAEAAERGVRTRWIVGRFSVVTAAGAAAAVRAEFAVRGEADSDRSLMRIRIDFVQCKLYCRWFGFERCERVDAAAERCEGERDCEALERRGEGDGDRERPASESVVDCGSSANGLSLCWRRGSTALRSARFLIDWERTKMPRPDLAEK